MIENKDLKDQITETQIEKNMMDDKIKELELRVTRGGGMDTGFAPLDSIDKEMNGYFDSLGDMQGDESSTEIVQRDS